MGTTASRSADVQAVQTSSRRRGSRNASSLVQSGGSNSVSPEYSRSVERNSRRQNGGHERERTERHVSGESESSLGLNHSSMSAPQDPGQSGASVGMDDERRTQRTLAYRGLAYRSRSAVSSIRGSLGRSTRALRSLASNLGPSQNSQLDALDGNDRNSVAASRRRMLLEHLERFEREAAAVPLNILLEYVGGEEALAKYANVESEPTTQTEEEIRRLDVSVGPYNPWDTRSVKLLVSVHALAPLDSGQDPDECEFLYACDGDLMISTSSLPECPICMLVYPALNESLCCSQPICTECYLQIRAPPSKSISALHHGAGNNSSSIAQLSLGSFSEAEALPTRRQGVRFTQDFPEVSAAVERTMDRRALERAVHGVLDRCPFCKADEYRVRFESSKNALKQAPSKAQTNDDLVQHQQQQESRSCGEVASVMTANTSTLNRGASRVGSNSESVLRTDRIGAASALSALEQSSSVVVSMSPEEAERQRRFGSASSRSVRSLRRFSPGMRSILESEMSRQNTYDGNDDATGVVNSHGNGDDDTQDTREIALSSGELGADDEGIRGEAQRGVGRRFWAEEMDDSEMIRGASEEERRMESMLEIDECVMRDLLDLGISVEDALVCEAIHIHAIA